MNAGNKRFLAAMGQEKSNAQRVAEDKENCRILRGWLAGCAPAERGGLEAQLRTCESLLAADQRALDAGALTFEAAEDARRMAGYRPEPMAEDELAEDFGL